MGNQPSEPVPEPKFGKTALELLDSRNAAPRSLSEKYGVQTGCAIVGGFGHVTTNWIYRRPLIAGAYMYAVWIGGGYLAGHLWMQHRKNYFAERDALMRHYIQLHPEDFPPPERKRYAEVLQEWVPIR